MSEYQMPQQRAPQLQIIPAKVLIDNLKVKCILGIRERERVNEQQVQISLRVQLDIGPCLGEDTTLKTIDYSQLANEIEQLMINGKFHLAETAAYEIAKYVLNFPPALNVWVRIEKRAISAAVDSVAVELEMPRESEHLDKKLSK